VGGNTDWPGVFPVGHDKRGERTKSSVVQNGRGKWWGRGAKSGYGTAFHTQRCWVESAAKMSEFRGDGKFAPQGQKSGRRKAGMGKWGRGGGGGPFPPPLIKTKTNKELRKISFHPSEEWGQGAVDAVRTERKEGGKGQRLTHENSPTGHEKKD